MDWFANNYVARVIAEERIHQSEREPIKMVSVNLGWLKKFTHSFIGMFL